MIHYITLYDILLTIQTNRVLTILAINELQHFSNNKVSLEMYQNLNFATI